uniref:Putative membrane glycoprotein lig-1 n=1 Tax=Lutzomyia longipalpis TaxID=7200 RepID=A0A1B0GIL8_LUTLO
MEQFHYFMLISVNFLLLCANVNAKGHQFRHVVSDRAISFTNCTIEDLKNIREFHLQPQDVIISQCHVPELPNALFLRTSSLLMLEITDCHLETLQDYALNGLNQLQVLNLTRNNISVVKSWSDHDLESVQMIDLRRNQLRELNKNTFRRFPNLTRLNLAVNFIETMKENTFKFTPHLKYINLGKNLITHIAEYTFKGLHKLTHLSLHHNQIRYIDFLPFNSHLKSLHLQGNELTVFEAELVANLPRLVHFNLSHNQLESLAEGIFKRNLELKVLDLSYNNFTEFAETSFTGLESLEYTFKGLHKLTHLSLHHNQIRYIDFFAFVSNSHLKSLHLQGNELTVFEAELVANLPRLVHFNLSHNQLESLAEGIFKRNLELKVLDLSYNNFTEFAETSFTGLESLEVFNISHNHIPELSKYIFREFTAVTHLILANNHLTALEDELLEFVPKVRVLNVSGNDISAIDADLFEGLKELQVVDLSWNHLTNVNFLPSIGGNLKLLDLSGNLFHSLDLTKFVSMQRVVLEGNPWHCRWLIRAMMTKVDGIDLGRDYAFTGGSTEVSRVAGIECVDEENGENRSVILLREMDKSPEDEGGNFNNWHVSTLAILHPFHHPHASPETPIKQRDARNSQSLGTHQAVGYNRGTFLTKSTGGIDDFDYKAIFLWLTIGIGVVFGVTKVCRILLIKSERRSEEWRKDQHEKYMQELEEIDEKYMQQQMQEHSIYKP